MITEIVGAVVLLLVYWYYKTYIAPKRLRAYYQKTLKDLGYKVFEYPYDPFGVPRVMQYMNDIRDHKDVLHTIKHVLPKYDVILSNLGTETHLHFLNPDLTEHLVNIEGVMLAPKYNSVYQLFYQLSKNSLLFVEGNEWKHRRRVLSGLFSHNVLMDMAPVIRQLCDRKFDQEEKRAKGRPCEPGKIRLNLQQMAESIFGNVIISFFLQIDSNEELIDGKPLNIALNEMNMLSSKLTYSPLFLTLGWRAIYLRLNADSRRLLYLRKEGMRVLNKYVLKVMYEFKEKRDKNPNYKPTSILEKVIHDMEEEKDLVNILSEEIYLFLIAGEENTSNFFVAFMYEVFCRPQVIGKLKAQINQHIKCEEDINGQTFKKMEYLHLVFEELLRLRSPSTELVDRYASQNMKIADIPVLKGTIMNTGYKAPFYMEKYFNEPLEFKPERWKEERYKSAKMQQMASMNFSAGPRNCIGKQLAYLESKIAIVKFLRRYDNLKELKERIYTFNFTARFAHHEADVTRINQSQ